jgi:uncharacterized protein YfkK (UPF0435 family)
MCVSAPCNKILSTLMKGLKELRNEPRHQEAVQTLETPKNLPCTFEDMVKGIVHNIRVNKVRSKMTVKTMEVPERYDLLTDIYELHKDYHELSFRKYDKLIHTWKSSSPRAGKAQLQAGKELGVDPNRTQKKIAGKETGPKEGHPSEDIPSIFFGSVSKKKIQTINVFTVLNKKTFSQKKEEALKIADFQIKKLKTNLFLSPGNLGSPRPSQSKESQPTPRKELLINKGYCSPRAV